MLVCELFSLASFSTKICGLNVLPILPVKVGTANQIEFQLYSKHKSGAMKNVDEEKAMDGNNGESL
jgi:hypothetical protein